MSWTATPPSAIFNDLRKRCPTKWLLSEDDRQIHPEGQRWMAERMGAAILSLSASHASLVSRPRETAHLIMETARLATPV